MGEHKKDREYKYGKNPSEKHIGNKFRKKGNRKGRRDIREGEGGIKRRGAVSGRKIKIR